MKRDVYKNDAEALLKVKEGNMRAYRHIFDSHFSDLCKFLYLYVSDSFIAEEIALDIFTSLWEKRTTLQIESSLKGYLFQAGKYKAISHLRKKKNEIYVDLNTTELQLKNDAERLMKIETDELRQIIEEAINSLPEKSREIYRMAREENMSHKQIATKLAISPKTVENHVGIALRKLRKSLKPYYEQIFVLCLIIFSK